MTERTLAVEILDYERSPTDVVRKIQIEAVFVSAVWTLITGFSLLLVIGFLIATLVHFV